MKALRRYIRGEYYMALGFGLGAFIVWASDVINSFLILVL